MQAMFARAREAIDFLERHRLEPCPAHYDLALRYLAAPDGAIARDVAQRTDGGLRLTPDDAAELIERHMGDATMAVSRREAMVFGQTGELRSLTSDAHSLATALGRDVGDAVARSGEWPEAGGDFMGRLSAAERELLELRGAIARLQGQIGQTDAGRNGTARLETEGPAYRVEQLRLGEVLEQLAARQGGSYVLLLFSLDDLPALNDRVGRSVGNNVLSALASTLEQAFPQRDIVRADGNEFLVVLPDAAVAAARTMAEDAIAMLRTRKLRLRGTGAWIGQVTASAGIAPGRGEPPRQVLESARAARLAAIEEGGDRVGG